MNRNEPLAENAPAEIPERSADFYLENGFVVFTEKFHRERGYCCHSGCRHCPFGDEVIALTTRL